MKSLFFWPFLLVGTFLQATITTVPFVVGILLVWYVYTRDNKIFLSGFICGILFDILTFHQLGISSLFFTLFIFLLFLYEKKFEVMTVPFLAFSSFLGSLAFLRMFNYHGILLVSVFNVLFTILFFKVISRKQKEIGFLN